MCLLLLFRLKSNSTWLRNPVNHKLCSIYNSTVHLEKRGTTDITQFSHVNRGIYRTVLFCVWFCRNWYYLHHHSTYRHTYPPVRISHRQTTRISHHDIRISQNSKSKWTVKYFFVQIWFSFSHFSAKNRLFLFRTKNSETVFFIQ